MGMHDGHRQRVWERYLHEGLDHFSDVQVLEMLLFFAHARGDTNPIAHKLLNRFGSLHQVLEAPIEELQKVDGVGLKTARLIHFTTSLGRYYMVNRAMQNTVISSVEKCGEFLIPFFHGRRNETVYLLCMDAKCKLLCCREVSEGSVNSAAVSPRKVVEIALSVNAATVVLAHNHPSGIAVPSAEDVQTTYRMANALDGVQIILADHIIVAEGDFTSMVQSGYYDPRNLNYR